MWDISSCSSEIEGLNIIKEANRDMKKDLEVMTPLSEEKYLLMQNAIVDIELRYFASATRETLRPEYKELISNWTNIIIKQRDI